jgi:hypothetical protein
MWSHLLRSNGGVALRINDGGATAPPSPLLTFRLGLAALALAALPAAALAQQPAPVAIYGNTPADEAEGSDDIIVIGDNGGQFRLTSDALRDAIRAFRQHRAAFAPASRLIFTVTAGDGGDLDGLTLYLRARRADRDGVRATIDLPFDAEGRIEMPIEQVATGNWDLRANRARGGIRIQPLVLSPGSSIADRRFGDMRLQCRVSIAFARLSLPMRALAGAVGPCGSRRVALYTGVPRAISAVTITGYTTPIDIRPNGMSFRVPLQDEGIGNEARLRLIYR